MKISSISYETWLLSGSTSRQMLRINATYDGFYCENMAKHVLEAWSSLSDLMLCDELLIEECVNSHPGSGEFIYSATWEARTVLNRNHIFWNKLDSQLQANNK